jgi:hypothetical protein
MSTSSYFMDTSPQYNDNGCPSQCMAKNEYTTIKDMYSFSTDPMTPLLAASPASPFNTTSNQPLQVASVGTTFSHPRIATNFKGPGVKYTGAQMAAILQGYAPEMNNKFGGRNPQ